MNDDYEPVAGRVWLDDTDVVFDCPPTTYEIALSRIETPADLVGWVHHMTEKRWVSTIQLRRFIGIVITEKQWAIRNL